MERLDYLHDLGVTALYFNPIFQSAANHRYHTHDYFRVDPLLGGDAAFDTLLDACRRRGLRVVLDGVFNHASRGFFQFNDILENGAASPWIDWFEVSAHPANAYDHSQPPGYTAWWGLHALPKFNTDNPQVREFLMRAGEYWMRKGIDGWRLDVADEIRSPGFWQEFRTRIRAINPEAYIVAEIWEESPQWLQGDTFDATMNYPLTEALLRFTVGDRLDRATVEGRSYRPYPAMDAPAFADRIDALLSLYPWPVTLVQLNLLDSHDTARFLTIGGRRRGQPAPGHAAAVYAAGGAEHLLRRRDRPQRRAPRPLGAQDVPMGPSRPLEYRLARLLQAHDRAAPHACRPADRRLPARAGRGARVRLRADPGGDERGRRHECGRRGAAGPASALGAQGTRRRLCCMPTQGQRLAGPILPWSFRHGAAWYSPWHRPRQR